MQLFLCGVLLLVLGCSACCWLCSCACWLCSSRFFSSFLPFSTLSAALRAHRRFDVLLAVLVPVLLLHLLFTTGSSAVVLSRILTTCSLAMAPSVFLSHHWLLGSGSVSDPPQRHFVVVHIFLDASPAPPTPLLSVAAYPRTPQYTAFRFNLLFRRGPRALGLCCQSLLCGK